jgi:hypothetical protein
MIAAAASQGQAGGGGTHRSSPATAISCPPIVNGPCQVLISTSLAGSSFTWGGAVAAMDAVIVPGELRAVHDPDSIRCRVGAGVGGHR